MTLVSSKDACLLLYVHVKSNTCTKFVFTVKEMNDSTNLNCLKCSVYYILRFNFIELALFSIKTVSNYEVY